ncbi:NUDIX domain-containing protein [Peribacillus frigoritolerans]|nr:NUDIX domain-containing protein [Peribacillus frigoritolerans]
MGGKIENGETPDMGAQREVFEETGIEAESFFF